MPDDHDLLVVAMTEHVQDLAQRTDRRRRTRPPVWLGWLTTIAHARETHRQLSARSRATIAMSIWQAPTSTGQASTAV